MCDTKHCPTLLGSLYEIMAQSIREWMIFLDNFSQSFILTFQFASLHLINPSESYPKPITSTSTNAVACADLPPLSTIPSRLFFTPIPIPIPTASSRINMRTRMRIMIQVRNLSIRLPANNFPAARERRSIEGNGPEATGMGIGEPGIIVGGYALQVVYPVWWAGCGVDALPSFGKRG